MMMDLESESIMDISALSMNLNPTEVTREEHFGLSASNFSVNVSKTTSWMDVLEESIKGLPDTKILAEKQQKRIRVAEEKLRTLEREREALEGRREVLQREKTAADDRLAAEEAEVDRLRASLSKARKEEEDALKEISDLTQRQDRAGDENDEDKFRVTMYRQMTGVRFGCPPADRPSEVSGYVSGRQPLKFLKTFRLDALESSPAFIGDYVWNLLHQAQADAWD